VKCSGAIDLDPTVDRGGEKGSHRRLGFRRVSGDVRPEVDVGEVLVVPRDSEDADGEQKRLANSERSSGCSIASSRRGERRLEKARTTVCFGRRRGA
jgi:hypothetical protein